MMDLVKYKQQFGGNNKVKYLWTELPVILNLNNDRKELLRIIVKKKKEREKNQSIQ